MRAAAMEVRAALLAANKLLRYCHDRIFGILILQKMALVLTSPRITVS